MEKIRVIIADDSDFVRDGMRIILDVDEDFEVLGVASTGREAIELAEKQAPASAPRPEPRTNARKTMETEIAGLRYYCSLVDIGPISGVVRADGKQLGYIPRAALDEFEAFNPKNLPCPFTGRITVDTSNHLYGTLHITQPGF